MTCPDRRRRCRCRRRTGPLWKLAGVKSKRSLHLFSLASWCLDVHTSLYVDSYATSSLQTPSPEETTVNRQQTAWSGSLNRCYAEHSAVLEHVQGWWVKPAGMPANRGLGVSNLRSFSSVHFCTPDCSCGELR